jgi:RNAse (barnase) inhibitor barstar
MTDPKLTITEKRDLVIQASMELVPYVGGPLSTLYFGSKQEKRFKRIESFYKEISEEIGHMKESISSLDNQDPDQLEAIIESLHEKIEIEPTKEKRDYLKNYFKNTLKHPVSGNFDERKYFLETLSNLTLLECELLTFLKTQSSALQVRSIQKPGVDTYAIVGSIGRLKTSGFISAATSSIALGGNEDNSLNEMVSITTFGDKFIQFCLE